MYVKISQIYKDGTKLQIYFQECTFLCVNLVCKICYNKFTFTGSTSGDECSQGDNVNKGLVPQLLCITYKSSYDPNTHMLGVGNH